MKYTTKVPSSDYLPVGAFPIVSQEEGLISGYWNNEADVFHHSSPVVIFGDHTRIIKYVDFDFVLGADGVKILLPVDGLSAKFLSYYLRWYKVPSLGYSRHFKLLKEASVPVPPVQEQEKIVAELDCLSGIIEKKKQQLKELDNLAQSIFYDMFGDPITNEKGWKTGIMKDVAPQKAYKGVIPSHNGQYWLLNLDMVEAQTGRIISEVYFDEKEIGSSTTAFNEEMVLYSKLRPYLNKVVLPMRPGFGTSELVPLLPEKSLLNRVFLAYLLRSHSFVDYISLKVAGAKMPRVSLDVFRRFLVILPPLELQNAFAQKIEAIDQQKELIKKSIQETETLFNSRMDYWFN